MNNPILKFTKQKIWPELVTIARDFVHADIDYKWTKNEELVLKRTFTNLDKRIFFIYNVLPANMITVMLAMYSRIKNPRGIRGIFVDAFLPQILTMFVKEYQDDCDKNNGKGDKYKGSPIKFLKDNNIKSLDDFIGFVNQDYIREGKMFFEEFVDKWHVDVEYFTKLAGAERMRRFLSTWLDQFGHNSIARPSMFYLCCEQISILAAKSIEWTRPGSGYIELSTRYVDMGGKDSYPIEKELSLYGIDKQIILDITALSFNSINELQGEKLNGLFSKFLWDFYEGKVPDDKMKIGVSGETFDVVNNLLPCTTLTSVGMGVSGEALPQLVRHLWLDQTPENDAIVEMIMSEALKVGADQFLEFVDISEWYYQSWDYLVDSSGFEKFITPREFTENTLFRLFKKNPEFAGYPNWTSIVEKLTTLDRSKYDKLYNAFEAISATFSSEMSFRSWRDLHRMGFSSHRRSLVTPLIGFYAYDKPTPDALNEHFDLIHQSNESIYYKMKKAGIPATMMQYPMAMGNIISYNIGSNLLQWEFCNWQRSKSTVNHEVRQQFLLFETALRAAYPWWEKISRADICSGYVFARGDSDIPLADVV